VGRPEAFKSADSLIASIIRSGVPSKKIMLTGHSLGGGLAQYAGIKNRAGTIVTFNTAPLNTQLHDDIASITGSFDGVLRHYVAFVSGSPGSGEGVMDPVSQRAGLSEFRALKVVGSQHTQYVIEVCRDLESPEYQSFYNTSQGVITHLTLSSLAMGDKYKTLINTSRVAGGVAGYQNATTDNASSALTGVTVADKGAKGYAAVANCAKHPFLCSAKAATGGIFSALANGYVPIIWNIYTAHRMKSLFDKINGYAESVCSPLN
jgi:hypothetical protein